MQLYERIFNDLFNKITHKEYKIGDFIPSETELVQIYEVSKAPVRQAVNELVLLGLVEKKQGKGSFVISNIPNNKPILSGFDKILRKNRKNLYCKTISVDIVKADLDISRKMKVAIDTPLVLIKRTRELKGEVIYFIYQYLHNINLLNDLRSLGDIQSLRSLMINKYGLVIDNITEDISSSHPNIEISNSMGIHENYPLLKIERMCYDKNNNIVNYSEYYVKSENWKYTVEYKVDRFKNVSIKK